MVAYLEFLKSDPAGREAAAGLLARMERHRSVVLEVLSREGVPHWLAYAALARSGFEPLCVDTAGAGGLWLLSAEQARALGLPVGYWRDGRRDPSLSTQAVARFLREEQTRSGSWEQSLLALMRGPRPPSDEPLPPAAIAVDQAEQRFVTRTMAVAVLGEHRELLGFPAAAAALPAASRNWNCPPA